MSTSTKTRLRIFNVAQDGFAFAINEETGTTVFLSRQLCAAHEINEDDVARQIDCFVNEGAKGPQANTLEFVDVGDLTDIDALLARLDRVEAALGITNE